MSTTPRIEVRHLGVTLGEGRSRVDAVKSVSFKVAPGESFGLVGESGSGKSTILRALCGLAPVSAGEVLIDGAPLTGRRDKSFAARVQMVFQDPYGSLHPRHTIDRILAEPLSIHGLKDRDRRILQALADVGLDPAFRFRLPHQLSGGQRQRIAIARALILEPSILLLDEPTSALDASIQAEVLNLLTRLRAERGLTYLFVSHDLAVVDHMCERLLVMRAGEAVETLDEGRLARRDVRSDYARTLMVASDGFVRPGEGVAGR
ncbi:ABC transporter ATP-binding protein [Aureimonas sp. AU40]|uniref:ABC transporter ATP-binding protein n=1 Tax=Aureimonas sp. AU40 TaxID=1637747 RepID=UPI0007829CA1|nr:ABC transporter ATP-binding protein [Aureimonas sp. AU40]